MSEQPIMKRRGRRMTAVEDNPELLPGKYLFEDGSNFLSVGEGYGIHVARAYESDMGCRKGIKVGIDKRYHPDDAVWEDERGFSHGMCREVVRDAYGKDILKSAKENPCNMTRGDARDLSRFHGEGFDRVISFGLIHNIAGRRERKKTFDESYKVMKEGGIFVVKCFSETGLDIIEAFREQYPAGTLERLEPGGNQNPRFDGYKAEMFRKEPYQFFGKLGIRLTENEARKIMGMALYPENWLLLKDLNPKTIEKDLYSSNFSRVDVKETESPKYNFFKLIQAMAEV